MKALNTIFMLISLGVWAQDRGTEAGEAAIKDPALECTPYSYPPLSAQLSSFPPAWKPAKIMPGDTAAQQRWQSIVSNVPNITVKPAPGSSSAANFHYGADDKDCWWTQTLCVTPKLSGLPPDIADVPEPSTLGYGFDDGPNCSHNAFYDYLASKNQKATMFFIGSNILDWPLETQRALTDGHEICVHTWSHTAMTSLASPDAFAELYYTMQLIKTVTGVTPTCWRESPPFGDVDDRIRAIANGLGLRTILWKFDSNDWKFGSAGVTKAQIDANYQNFIDKATNGTFSSGGAIILTHELNNFTMQEAINFHDRLSAAFKYIVPVAVAFNKTQPYVESNYSMPTFEQYITGLTMMTPNSGVTQVNASQVNASQTPTEAPTQPQPTKTNAGVGLLPFTNIFVIVISVALCAFSH